MCHTGRRDQEKWGIEERGKAGYKGCVKKNQLGIPIRETDEGTAEDDSNI